MRCGFTAMRCTHPTSRLPTSAAATSQLPLKRNDPPTRRTFPVRALASRRGLSSAVGREPSGHRLPGRAPAGSCRYRQPVPAAGFLPPRPCCLSPRPRRSRSSAAPCRCPPCVPGAASCRQAGRIAVTARRSPDRPGTRPRRCRAFCPGPPPVSPCPRPRGSSRLCRSHPCLHLAVPQPASLRRCAASPAGACPRPLAVRRPAVPPVAVSTVPCRAVCRRPACAGPGRASLRAAGRLVACPRRAPLRLPPPGPSHARLSHRRPARPAARAAVLPLPRPATRRTGSPGPAAGRAPFPPVWARPPCARACRRTSRASAPPPAHPCRGAAVRRRARRRPLAVRPSWPLPRLWPSASGLRPSVGGPAVPATAPCRSLAVRRLAPSCAASWRLGRATAVPAVRRPPPLVPRAAPRLSAVAEAGPPAAGRLPSPVLRPAPHAAPAAAPAPPAAPVPRHPAVRARRCFLRASAPFPGGLAGPRSSRRVRVFPPVPVWPCSPSARGRAAVLCRPAAPRPAALGPACAVPPAACPAARAAATPGGRAVPPLPVRRCGGRGASPSTLAAVLPVLLRLPPPAVWSSAHRTGPPGRVVPAPVLPAARRAASRRPGRRGPPDPAPAAPVWTLTIFPSQKCTVSSPQGDPAVHVGGRR